MSDESEKPMIQREDCEYLDLTLSTDCFGLLLNGLLQDKCEITGNVLRNRKLHLMERNDIKFLSSYILIGS